MTRTQETTLSLSDLIAAEAKRPGTKCSFIHIFKTLDKADRATLEAALADESVTGASLHRALLRAGFTLGKDTVRRHRSGECSCGTR